MNKKLKLRVVQAMEQMLQEIKAHNDDYHHHTDQEKIKEWDNIVGEIEADEERK